jgi:hypothetical protein
MWRCETDTDRAKRFLMDMTAWVIAIAFLFIFFGAGLISLLSK